jgi:hypothetical protein
MDGGTENKKFSHEFIAGAGIETETNFLMALKVPDLDRDMEIVIFG